MRRNLPLALLALLVAAGVAAAPKAGQKLYVRAPTAKVLKSPSLLAGQAAPARFGDEVVFVEAKSDFYKVRTAAGVEGWLYRADVVDSAVKLKSGQGSAASSYGGAEADLAARGFSPQVEQSYRQQHGEIRFDLVDAMDNTPVDQDGLAAFVVEGGIGGAP
jgi:hypothetical protein